MHYIVLILIAKLAGALFTALLRVASESGYDAFQVIFLYNLITLSLVILWMYKNNHSIAFLKTGKFTLFGVRGMLEFCGFALMCYSVKFIPLPAFASLGFVEPILASIAAVILLKEKASWQKFISLLGGFIGAMVIINPIGYGIETEALYRLLATLIFALSAVTIKKLTNTETIMRIVFYAVFFTTVFSAPFAFKSWQPPSLEGWGIFAVMGVLFFIVQITISQAFRKANLSDIMPFYFAELLFSSVIAYFAFDEMINIGTVIGAVIIIKSAIVGAYKTKKPAPAVQGLV